MHQRTESIQGATKVGHGDRPLPLEMQKEHRIKEAWMGERKKGKRRYLQGDFCDSLLQNRKGRKT